MCVCVCIPILVTMFPEWLSGTEPLPHIPDRRVRPRCVYSVLRVDAHFDGLITTFNDTAITDRHSDITIFQLRAHS